MAVDPLLAAFIDAASMTLSLLLAGRFIAVAPRSPSAWLILLLVVNGICGGLLARQEYAFYIPTAMQLHFGDAYWLMNMARNSSSAIFLILIHRIFVDQPRFPWWIVVLYGIQMFIEEPLGWLLGPQWTANDTVIKVGVNEIAPALVQATFAIVAVVWLLRDWHTDLLAKRRATRGVGLIILGGAISLAVERFGFFLGLVHVDYMYFVHVVIVAMNCGVSVVILFALMREDIIGYIDPSHESPAAAQSPPAVIDHPDVTRIVSALEQEHLYRTAGLSVNSMARHLQLPEYRLRALIHEHLGYKNFNTLLHHYRIEEVCTALADPEQHNTPILTLALSAGYQSIAPFNRAFRQKMGITPSTYRANALKNS